jgi:hypothetical protein
MSLVHSLPKVKFDFLRCHVAHDIGGCLALSDEAVRLHIGMDTMDGIT